MLSTERHCVRIVAERAPDRVLTFRGGSPEEGGWVSRGFGRKQPATTVAWESAIEGTTVLKTYICVEGIRAGGGGRESRGTGGVFRAVDAAVNGHNLPA
jgi:hypothetical protein